MTVEDWGKGRTDFSETVSGQHFYIESGGSVLISGQPVDVSGSHVWISGQHVFIGSGIYVTTQPEIAISGTVSVQSGLHVVVGSGLGVIGDFTTEVASGLHVVGDFSTTVDSGLYVVVESGLNVVGDFTAEVASGLHVVGDFTAEVDVSSGLHVQISGQHVFVESDLPIIQSKTIQVANYSISDIDEKTDINQKFYGYLDANGNWYIMQERSGIEYRYASSGIYASNWIDRSGIIYQTFDQEF